MDTDADPPATGPIDVSNIPFDKLVNIAQAPLARAFREAAERAAKPGPILAAFDNFLLHEPGQR